MLDRLYENEWDYVLGAENELPAPHLPERYLKRRAAVIDSLEDRLGELAAQFRRSATGSEAQARAIEHYHQVMEELFWVGDWGGEPAAVESLLPDELLPKVYRDHWARTLREYKEALKRKQPT